MSDYPSLRDQLADQYGIAGQLAWRLLPMVDQYAINWMSAATYANEEFLDCDRRTFFKLQLQLISAGLVESTGRVTDPPDAADFPQILRQSGHARRRLTAAGKALVLSYRERKETRYQTRLSRRMRKLARKGEATAYRAGKREQAAREQRTPKIYRDMPRDRGPAPKQWTAEEIDAAMLKAQAAWSDDDGPDPPE